MVEPLRGCETSPPRCLSLTFDGFPSQFGRYGYWSAMEILLGPDKFKEIPFFIVVSTFCFDVVGRCIYR